ncbi:uncharacterized protein BXZ73DRAFT_89051 [Epithele typhae]|uniref:uncharacterized protein n=1 Tax=Epithele typhae TaxID=378194 RepID=UPI00200774A2|nr:uncharacterized protein BXZ73DRAFT_89051 [Epithele typhae]KAH9939405.1 hypothetical protein BXZ73DRAFT_89051 [Epithele typhae]
MFSRWSSTSKAVQLQVLPAIYPSGANIEGEVAINLRHAHEEEIDKVEIRFCGYANTWIKLGNNSTHDYKELVRETTTLWTRGSGVYSQPGSDILSVPFSFTLPDKLPPSFHAEAMGYSVSVRYSITAVGVRKGRMNVNKQHCVPLTVVPKDDIGVSLKRESATHGWKTFSNEQRIRKGFWGDYSKVLVELKIPSIPVFPLSSTIPYTIIVTTTSPPLSPAQAAALPPGKLVFPPIPTSPDALDFTLGRRLYARATGTTTQSYTDIAAFLGPRAKAAAAATGKPRPPVDSAIDDGKWVATDTPDAEKGTRKDEDRADRQMGTWVQRAVFESTFTLDCPPSFVLSDFIKCAYDLVVNVPFPGVGNTLRLEASVVVTSGVETTVPHDVSAPGYVVAEALTLDLPPAYWDTSSSGWDTSKKVSE